MATVLGDTASLKASDFVITNTYSKANLAVKSISVDKTDKSQVTLETYVAMNDGKDYTVAYDGTTKNFTATDGKVIAATISPATVVVPTPASESDGSNANDIKVSFTDKNGVKIAEVKKSTANNNKIGDFTYIDIDVDATNNGYMSGDTLNLYKVGNTAKVKVTAHTGKYDSSAKEIGNVTAEAVITGVDATAVTTAGWNVKFAKATDVKANTEFKDVKESKVAAKDSGIIAYVQRSLSNTKVDDAKDYSFESSDKDIMAVSKLNTSSVTSATAISVTPFKAGTAYIIVKDSKNNVVTTLPVTIGEARKASSLVLDKTAFTLSSATNVDKTVTVKATVKDQYGADVTVSDLMYKEASQDDSYYTNAGVVGDKITINKPSLKDDKDTSYTYIVKSGDLKATFVVTVRKAGTNIATYALELSSDSVDAVIKSDANDDTTVTAKVCGYDSNGVKLSDGEDATFTLKKDGKAAKDAAGVTTSSAIKINDLSTGKQMAAGTYLVEAVANGKTFTKTFTVTNTQSVVSVKRIATEASSLDKCFEFNYEGNKNPESVVYYGIDDKPVTAVGTVYVSKAVVKYAVGKNHVEQTVNIGLTVTVK